MAAIFIAILVGKASMNMGSSRAGRLSANNSVQTYQFDGRWQIDGCHVAVAAGLSGDLLGIEEGAAIQTANAGKNHTVEDMVLITVRLNAVEHVLARLDS